MAYEDKSDAELIAAMGNTTLTPGGDREAQVLRAELDRRAAQQQSESASKLAVATDSLVKATKGLGHATWMLVTITALLTLAAFLQVYATWPRIGR